MNVHEVAKALATIAPTDLAEEWDNVGLLVGDADAPVTTLLLCIDLTPAVLDEAQRVGAQMVMAYHPVIFKGLSRLTTGTAPVVLRAAQMGLAVYSMHTALDAAAGGTNDVLADMLGLTQRRAVKTVVRHRQVKVVTFVPPTDLSRVADAAFQAGAGRIGAYDRCSFFSHGIGTFCGREGTHPAVGQAGRQEAVEELRLEVIAPVAQAGAVRQAIRDAHSYEEPPIDIYPLESPDVQLGLGRIGRLEKPATLRTVLGRIKRGTGRKRFWVAHAEADRSGDGRTVETAAVCAGSAGSLALAAAAMGATLYVTGEMRHHDALAATAAGLTCVCLGHSHSERMTLPVVAERLGQMLPDLATHIAEADRDPLEIV